MVRSSVEAGSGGARSLWARVCGGRCDRVLEDLETAYRKDPALGEAGRAQALLYPGVLALGLHRVAHRLWRAHRLFPGRLVSQVSRALTGIEIHPAAVIGRRCFIDHGAGVVIGETAVIGDDVTMYHGVTLGGRGWWRDAKGARRHPSVGNGVTLGAGAVVIGPVHIGDGARVGPLALVLRDVPPGAHVRAPAAEIEMARAPANGAHLHETGGTR